ncbi:MAG TPA: malto-oligosyltrehalose trehalohydrolase [Terriglobales bacterium]|nr:malto-oligosyltrehalose trehalohydrolase [Terriglobales bacterium]
MIRRHSMPFGAECLDDGKVRFRLWAPKAQRVDLSLANQEPLDLSKLEDGWFELITHAPAGSQYQFQIDGQTKAPDPASRFQPSDVHGPSQVVDPAAFDWQDEHWRGRPWEEAVTYELHVGTFTPEGTFAAAEQRLDYLADLGITAVELMPIADFAGARNWGYDGVLPFAPDNCYGHPDDLKRLIQAAHRKGLMAFLDVVYNHFGPEGNYLRTYAPEFFTARHRTPWGDAINFDGPGSRVVRDFFIHNALYWLEEYHFDGLRLDAVHAIVDESTPDILTELAKTVRAKFSADGINRSAGVPPAPNTRIVHLVLENDQNAAHYLTSIESRRDAGATVQQQTSPRLYDAQWNDDIHHALHVLITGETDGYYCDYSDQPIRHLGRCLAEGFSYQGQLSRLRNNTPRGEPSRDLPPTCFVSFLQNHDQVGNRAYGERILKLAEPKALKAALAILLLAPSPPLLFMGEEFGADTPFLFFCDFEGELATAVTEGRRSEFARFERFSSPASRASIPDPNADTTFTSSKLDWNELDDPNHQSWLSFYRDLLARRRNTIVPYLRNLSGRSATFTVGQSNSLAVNWKLDNKVTLRLIANLGPNSVTPPAAPVGRLIYSTVEGMTENKSSAGVPPALAQLNITRPTAGGIPALPKQRQLPPWSVAWFLHP